MRCGREDMYLVEAWWLYRGWPGTDSNGAWRGTDPDVRRLAQSHVQEGRLPQGVLTLLCSDLPSRIEDYSSARPTNNEGDHKLMSANETKPQPLNRPDYEPIDQEHPAMVAARARAALLRAACDVLATEAEYAVRYPESTFRCGAVHGVLAHIPFNGYDLALEAAARAFIAARDDPSSPWPLADMIAAGVERAWSEQGD